ncbi:Endoglucanase precursor [Pelotomaculum schinkii]|uniref:Endoglucanase n=1 Tax=Pelotomaculum schinkii TaxID=78350 RepID=A0A4Y7RGY4_9FIRM|nr:S-layer homology domain-containing protein [Pelotomaculum schinkii]TEB08076.1 Endoglucanase precursor [Pelotomaculum schinkii]
MKQKKWRYKLLMLVLVLLMLVGTVSLTAPADALAAGSDITISGPGLNGPGPVTITQNQLRGTESVSEGVYLQQQDVIYSTINTWPTKSWYRGQGVKLTDLLDLAGGLKPEATQIRFTSGDKFKVTFTVDELLNAPQYRFPNFMSSGLPGHLPGNPSGKVLVDTIIAHRSFSAQSYDDILDAENFNRSDANLLLYGQRAVTQQTNSRFSKWVVQIEVLTDPVPKWDNPTVTPAPGVVPAGTMVEMHSPFDDEDKVHYTLDGSDPTIDSPMYNWIAKRWWSSRPDDLAEINHKIGPLNRDTTVKAVVIGPGRSDSDIVTFSYQVPDSALLTADVTDNVVGQPVELTFTDDAAWRAAITGVSVDGADLVDGGYTVSAGKITIAATVFTKAKDYTVVVKATGYEDACVTQTIKAGSGGNPDGDVKLTITGDGVAAEKTYTLAQLQAMDQYEQVYSAINTWPSKRWCVGKGVKLRTLLNEAGMKSSASLIKFTASDGVTRTLTVQELLKDRRYYFPGLKDNDENGGQVPGSSAGRQEVEPILALESAEGSVAPGDMNGINALLLMLGQRAVTEQNLQLFLKYVVKIEVSTEAPDKWDEPEAEPDSGEVAPGTLVKLSSEINDDDKIHYTTDGSPPTIDSPMYNWIASRWWSSRESEVDSINHPIEITEDTTIKAVTIGPGKRNSNVVTFTYKVKEDPTESSKISSSQGGAVEFGSGEALIEIPPGALTNSDAEVGIRKVSNPPAVPSGFKLLGSVYEFLVDGEKSYSFAQSVTITLHFDPGALGEGEIPSIYYYDEELEQWVNLGGEVSGNTITIQVDHFTKFAVMVAGEPGVATGLITPGEGGTVSLGSEAAIEIPAGALTGSSAVEVKIEKVAAPPAAPAGFKPAGSAYAFSVDGKSSYSFAKSVTIKLSFDPDTINGGETPAIYCYDEKSEQWVNLGGEVSGNSITVQVDHFTMFAVMVVVQEPALTDIAGHWAFDSINKLLATGSIGGYPDGTFRPDNPISRAEFITVLVKAFGLEHKKGKSFADTAGHWAEEYIATATACGIVNGYDGGNFGPDELITREQMAVMIVKAAKIAPAAENPSFDDSDSISGWAAEAVNTAAGSGIMKGYPDNTIRPQGNATRAEAVTVIIDALNISSSNS